MECNKYKRNGKKTEQYISISYYIFLFVEYVILFDPFTKKSEIKHFRVNILCIDCRDTLAEGRA